MLNKISRFILTASAVAPVCFTIAFIGFINSDFLLIKVSMCIGVISWILGIVLVSCVKKTSGTNTKNLVSLTPANKEITNYFLTYLFPLLGSQSIFTDWRLSLFFYICLFFYMSFSESYNFNPLLSIFGYRFYEAQDDTGVGFVLLTKEPIIDASGVTITVKQLTEYIYIKI